MPQTNDVIGRVFGFENDVFANEAGLYGKLAHEGQAPKVLMISCSDSRIVPEQIMQAKPGELFVIRNAGNIVPPFAQQNGGVTATIEYAVAALGVTDVVICGHSGCGAMGALTNPEGLDALPSVKAWLKHSHAAKSVVDHSYPDLDGQAAIRAASLENVVVQLQHLRTHPAVASRIAKGELTLHGWFVDIHSGSILALDGTEGRFKPVRDGDDLPVALSPARRLAADFVETDEPVAA
ncbi:carbonic anhydrase [Sphingomonas sp. Leaf33]|uniref:carbonic anhydrase n=1 Tax=Sphingomonas sp. Leaf33 TaxID=1736215 RepID=UPI0006F913C7|nr:carbonic anhydrase [Sphingomonas sp. Leaf33]KQN26994.1 carbonic anhydrase [Sphingomonas sp. Leaf33]